MRVLYLTGPFGSDAILSYLRAYEEAVTVWDGPLDEIPVCDAVVACNYKHVIPADVLERLPLKRANLHISYLPWNRGSQPNYWSWVDGTEKGVSIHQITEQLDRGPLYAQRRVQFGDGETLATPHARLEAELFALFVDTWRYIRTGKLTPIPQVGAGSFHDRAAFTAMKDTLSQGWDTPVSELVRERVPA